MHGAGCFRRAPEAHLPPFFSPGSNPTCQFPPSAKAKYLGGPELHQNAKAGTRRAVPWEQRWDRGQDRTGGFPQCRGQVPAGGRLCQGGSEREAIRGMAEA